MDNRWTIEHSDKLNEYQVYSDTLKAGPLLTVFNAFSIGDKVILNLLFEDTTYVYPVLFAELNPFKGRLTIPSNALSLITEDVADTLRIQLLHNERKLGQHRTLFFTKSNSFFARLLRGIHNPQRTPYLGLTDIRTQKKAYLLYKQIAESLRKKALNILDLGCGSGYGAALLARAGFNVTAIDMDNLPITYAKRLYTDNTITFACQGIEEVLQKGEKFDAVVACEVLEHNDDYASFLEMLTDVTRTEGKVALSVPSWVYHGIDLNSDHRTNWTFTKLDKVLKRYFRLHDKYIINFAIDPQQYSIEATETNAPDAEHFLFIGKKVTGPAGFNPRPSSVLLVCHNIPPYEYTGTPLVTRRYARGLQRLGYRVAVLVPNLPVAHSKSRVVLEENDSVPIYRVHPVDFIQTSIEALSTTDRLKLQPFVQIFNHFCPHIVHIIDYVFLPPQILQLAADYGAAVIRHVCNTEEICLQVSPVISPTRKICAGPDNARACARCISSPALADNDIFTARQVSQLAGQISGWQEYIHYLYSKVVDAVIFTTISFGEYFLKYLPVPGKKIYHVPRGLLSPAFPKRRRRDKEQVTFGFLGEIVFHKGIDLLVKAFEELPENKVELLVYGKVHDQVLFNELKDVRCTRYMGEFTPEDIDGILQDIDVGIVPSHFETHCMVLREFLSYNIPVIATRFFGSEIIQDGENGLLIEIGNAEELRQKLLDIINNKDLLVRLQAGAYATKLPSIYGEIDAVHHIYQETYERKFGVRGELTGASRNNVDQFASIIIPVYNNWEYTRQCLLSLEAEDYRQQAEVIVVDNASTDATATRLKSEFPWVEVIRNEQNLGFAKACNRGAERARGKYLVFLNNDTKVQKGWLEALIAACEGEAGAGIVGSKLLYPDGRLQHAGVEIAYPGGAFPIHPGHLRYGQPDAPDARREVEAVTGAAMLLPRAVFYELGGFEEVYQNGYEDVDLCLKARAGGYRILYEPASRAIHYESKTPGRFDNEIKNINIFHRRWLPYVLQHFRKASSLQETQPSNRPPVSIIIVTYNSLATIAACLESVLATTTAADEIIVVDNNSRDETSYYVECLQKVLPAGRVQLHCETGNMGYAGAAARGAAIASREIFVFLNPDTVVFPGWLEGLAQPLAQGDGRIAASGPVSNYAAGLQNVIHYAERDYLEKETVAANIARTLGEQQRGKVVPTDLLIGSCLAVKRKIYAEMGEIDADLFLGKDDLDFSWRLARAGYGQVVVPGVFVYHRGQKSFQTEPPSKTTYKIQKTSWRPQHFHESCEANTLSNATRQAGDRCKSPQKLRIAVYSFDMPQHACARYRILASAERFADAVEVRWGVLFQKDRIDVDLELGKWADLIIIQRFFPMAQTYGFIETLLATGKAVIYETDDHLLEIPESNPHKRRADESMPYILKCLSQATAVTVSTDELRKAFRPYHHHIYMLPNLLDDRLLPLPNSMKQSEGPVIIGYAGTPTHADDLALLEAILERLADKYGDRIAFRFMGCRTNRLEALPHSTFTPLSGYIDYVKNLQCSAIDIGLAPLADNTFNRCKSAVEWLEYSACGIAGVYSDLPPYRSAVQNGVSGILVSSTDPKSWTTALERLIENPDHRRSIGLAAQSQVFTRHTLKARGRLFLNTWKWIAANKPNASSKKVYLQPVPLANQEDTHHDLSHFKLLPQIEHQTQKESLTAPSVSIIIPTYNNHALTRTCLTSLYKKLADMPYEIICVDNASTDGTTHLLEAEASKKRICLIQNNQNLGFAKACNQGAFSSQGKFVVFLNNDTVVREGWLDAMIQCIKSSPDIGVVGSKLLYPEGTIQHAGVTFDSQAIPYHIYRFADADASYVNKERSFSAVTGACMLLKREAFIGIGGFDEAFQNGLEDVDLCLRIRREGLRVRYCPQSVVCHYESVSPGRFTKARENYSYFFEKWGKDLPVAEDVGICTEDSTDIHRVRSFEKVWRAGNIHDRRKTIEYRKECETSSTDMKFNHKIHRYLSTPLVSIIMLSLNQVEWTKRSLESVKTYTDLPYEIIVVDNGSEKETLQHLLDFARTEDRIRIISNSENRGFAAGNNQGLTIARGDYFLLLNNDTLVTPGWLRGLLDVFQRFPNTGIAGPMSNCVAGLQLIPSARYRDSEEMEAFAAYWRYMYRRQTILVESVIGFCMLIRRAVVEAIGGLDEIFGKGNFEDNDFCLRARLKGFEVRIAKDVFIHHQGSLTFSSEKIDYSRAMKRNWELFKAKWGLPPHTQLGDAAVHIDPEKSARQYVQLPDLSATHSEDIPGKFWRERSSSQRSLPQRPCRSVIPVHRNHVTAENH